MFRTSDLGPAFISALTGFQITTAGLRSAMGLCIFAGCISRRANRVTGAAWFDAPVSRANRNLGLGGRHVDARRAEVAFRRTLSGPSDPRKQVGRGTNRQMPTPTRNTTARDNSTERYPIIRSIYLWFRGV